ncbi:peptidase C39 family protein [Actinoplanes rectilineatus]|uniref:peptidase C39 family protein n=1 Tax=Actinoplanes rectilineatus TaxID=113571 RepID=UPI0005F2BFA6|nr:peptidase C39 family protein [Actinoplanes rectilineatus]
MITPFDRSAVPADLVRLAPPEVLRRWTGPDRGYHDPRLVVTVDADGTWTGAALVTARPRTAYLKIVDVVGVVPPVCDEVVAYARRSGMVQIKWEGWTAGPATGFTAMLPPLPSGPGSAEPGVSYVRWLAEPSVRESRYYRQTLDFSCGAVTALTAAMRAGDLDAAAFGPDAEVDFWRAATNFMACEPVGLGVAVRRARPHVPVHIDLDTDQPVMLGHLTERDQQWRARLQRRSRDEAAEAGVPVESRRLPIDEVTRLTRAGTDVLLLITADALHGVAVPHWLLCHGTAGDTVVTEDPFVTPGIGESWVDGHLLPIAAADLDAMAAIDEGGHRGAVRLG